MSDEHNPKNIIHQANSLSSNPSLSTPERPNGFDFHVVGVGASAGGLEALEAFF